MPPRILPFLFAALLAGSTFFAVPGAHAAPDTTEQTLAAEVSRVTALVESLKADKISDTLGVPIRGEDLPKPADVPRSLWPDVGRNEYNWINAEERNYRLTNASLAYSDVIGIGKKLFSLFAIGCCNLLSAAPTHPSFLSASTSASLFFFFFFSFPVFVLCGKGKRGRVPHPRAPKISSLLSTRPPKKRATPQKKNGKKNEIRDPGLCRRRHRLPPRLPGQALALPTSLGRPGQHTGSRRDHRSPPWEASGHRGRRQRGSRRRRRALARRRARRRGPLPREPPSTRTFLDGRRDPADSLRLGGPGPVPSRPRLGLGADPLRQRGPRVGKRRDLLHRLDRRPSGAASEVARNPGLRHVLHVAGLALLGRPGGQALPPRPEHGENCGGLDGELV